MSEKRKESSHSFTWGMLVGGALVLMLTTKKGRQIFKELVTDGGIEGLEGIIDIDKVRELAGDFETDEEEEDAEQVEVQKKPKKQRFFKRGK